jgi:4-aminobutyrate aminotransferase-like enzyme/Ser/Thr protein kinase RdoA (MazF antagonist)
MSSEELIALRAGSPPIGTAAAQNLARGVYGVSAVAVPLQGERDRNFKLIGQQGEYLLKVLDPATSTAAVECQVLAMAHLVEQAPELPIPRIIQTQARTAIGHAEVDGAVYRVLMMDFMPGELVTTQAAGFRLLGTIGQTLGRLDHALRGFFHAALSQPIVWDVRRAPALLQHVDYLAAPATQRLVRGALEAIIEQAASLRSLRAQAIHGDFHPCNVLVNAERDACTGVLDFGDMIHAPRVLDPAVTMAEFLIQGAARLDQIDAVLAGYCSAEPLEGEEIDALYDLITARIAVALLVIAWRRHHDPTGAAATAESFVFAEESLADLTRIGRPALTQRWHRIAGTIGRKASARGTASPIQRGATTEELLQRRHRLMGGHAEYSYDTPIHLVRGVGVWVYAADGQRFLDVYNNVPHVGHAHPVVINAVRAQASRIASNTRYLDEVVLEYAERLTGTLPPGLDACLFVNSGSEANDIAWQMAQLHTGRRGALVMTHAYHGITQALNALSPEVRRFDDPDVEALAVPPGSSEIRHSTSAELAALAARKVQRALEALQHRGRAVAALMLDSAFTSSGIYDPPASWMAPITAAVHTAGGLIIGDEVQYGLGRSGSDLWGFARRGYTPDIVTLGKPIGNGYPLGVVITRRELLERFQKETRFFSTFGGNPVAAAAGLAVLDIVERDELMAKAYVTGSYLNERLGHVATSNGNLGEIRGSGLLIGVEVVDAERKPDPRRARFIVNGLRNRGVLIGSTGPDGHILKLRPPMAFGIEHVDELIDKLTAVLRSGPP